MALALAEAHVLKISEQPHLNYCYFRQ